MPRAKSTSNANGLPTQADIAELQATLVGTLSGMRVEAFPREEWATLAVECIRAGYTLVLSPQMDGRAVRLSIPVGKARLPIVAMSDAELLEGIRALRLALAKLTARG